MIETAEKRERFILVGVSTWGCEKMRFHFSQPTFFLKLKFTGLKRVHFPFPQNEHRFCYHAAFWRRICLL